MFMNEFLKGAKVIRLRSHIDKYLESDQNGKPVRQRSNGSNPNSTWTVHPVPFNQNLIRLRGFHGGYLATSPNPFLLGVTGRKVITQSEVDSTVDWIPYRDGFQLTLRTAREEKYLRANGSSPPWRNSVTYDMPASFKNWILWDVEAVESTLDSSTLASPSSFSSSLSDQAFETPSPMSVVPNVRFKKTGMDMFKNAKAVRLRSHHDKYLLAHEDEESVTQHPNGSSKSARWSVDFSSTGSSILLKSCYGKYLTASNQPFLLGMTGRKVIQTLPTRLDSSVEWIPVRDGPLIKLKTRYDNFLRANGGLPPWRNSVTHDVPHRTSTQDWVLWDVEVVEILTMSPTSEGHAPEITRQESSDNLVNSPPKMEGRRIYYSVGDDGAEEFCLTFKGNEVNELTRRLEEATGLEDILVCSRSPLNGKLYPLHLQLPPNNATIHVSLLQSSSKAAKDIAK